MATKRKPVLPDDLDLEDVRAKPGAAQPQTAFHEAAAPAVLASGDGGGVLKEKAINMSIYLLPDDHRRLRMLAVTEDTSIQSLVMDGIDAVLRQRGQEPVTRWEPRRKPR